MDVGTMGQLGGKDTCRMGTYQERGHHRPPTAVPPSHLHVMCVLLSLFPLWVCWKLDKMWLAMYDTYTYVGWVSIYTHVLAASTPERPQWCVCACMLVHVCGVELWARPMHTLPRPSDVVCVSVCGLWVGKVGPCVQLLFCVDCREVTAGCG